MPVNKWLIGFFIIISFVGFTDAAYLTFAELTGRTLSCSVTHGCETVTQSQFSHIFGIPVAALGVVYYLSIFVSALHYLDQKRIKVLKFAATATCLGLIASAWFVYVQGVILQAWCQFCLLSAFTSTVLFGIGVVIWQQLIKQKINFSPETVFTADEFFSTADGDRGNQE